jgi:hypothetical protein
MRPAKAAHSIGRVQTVNDDTYVVDYAFLLRDVSGDVRVVHDRHVEGLFPRARWFEWFEAAGRSAHSDRDQWGRDVFVARPIKSNAFR